MSGPAASSCGPTATAAKAYIDHVNSSGGVNGHMIKLTVSDDMETAAQALANARTFQSNNDLAILGGCGSTPTGAIGSYANSVGIPFLWPLASAPALASPVETGTFLLYPEYEKEFPAGIKSIMAKNGAGSVFSLIYEIPDDQQVAAAIKTQVLASGGTYLGTDFLGATIPDVGAEILKIKNLHPDYLVTDISTADATAIINGAIQQNALPTKKLIVTAGNFGTAFDAALGTAGPITLGIGGQPPSGSPQLQSCEAIYQAAGIAETADSDWGCMEAQALVAALQGVQGTITRSSLIAELNSWSGKDVSPALPSVTFSTTDHGPNVATYVDEVQNGKITAIDVVPPS